MTRHKKLTLHDRDVCAPDDLNIRDVTRHEATIAATWEKVKLYAKAMEALNRSVLLSLDGEGNWYWSSVENAP